VKAHNDVATNFICNIAILRLCYLGKVDFRYTSKVDVFPI